jgi:hypothetical protein
MPLPKLQPAREAAVPQSEACRVFVSYSHRDMQDAERFMGFLRAKLREVGSTVGIGEPHVFFDRRALLAGDQWDDSIQSALEQARYFIFLVSVDSLNSSYCLTRELSIAVARGLPILPILLKPCPWEGQPAPGDPQGRTLSAFGALPRDDAFALRPVSEWKSEAVAWNTVVNQLAERLLHDRGQPTLPASIAHPTAGVPPRRLPALLPYFCDQIRVVSHFNGELRGWNRPALLVIARGCHEDNVPRFWERLRVKNLADYVHVRDGALLAPRPLVWPQDTGQRRSTSELAADMLGALSEALTGNSFELADPPAIGAWLAALPGVATLVTTLPRERRAAMVRGLCTLLDVIEQCPQPARHRLVVAAVIEHDGATTGKELARSTACAAYAHTQVIDLMPLNEIGEPDIRRWHRDHEIELLCGVTEEDLLARVRDPSAARLRLGIFDARVKPILGL